MPQIAIFVFKFNNVQIIRIKKYFKNLKVKINIIFKRWFQLVTTNFNTGKLNQLTN